MGLHYQYLQDFVENSHSVAILLAFLSFQCVLTRLYLPAVRNQRRHEWREEQAVQGEEEAYEEIDESAGDYEQVDDGDRWKKKNVFELQRNTSYAVTKFH